jgi:hypothetical protein
VPERTYQVRVAGLLGLHDLQSRLHELDLSGHQVRTVLVGRFSGQHALLGFLREIRAHGLEVLDVRRLPRGEAAEAHEMAGPTVRGQLTHARRGYAFTVAGDIGGRASAALAPYATALEQLHTVLRTRTPEDVEFVDLVLLLESRGLKIASIAVMDEGPAVPKPRIPLQRLPESAAWR